MATVSYNFQDSNGGSTIVSYHLMYIDSFSGHWIDLAGSDKSLATQHTFQVQKGLTYNLKYRVLNAIGWSDFSPLATFIAADVPSKPNPVTLVYVSST